MGRSAGPQAVQIDVQVDPEVRLTSCSSRARVDPRDSIGRTVESTEGISLHVCSPSGVTSSGSTTLDSCSQPTSTLRSALSSSASGSLVTTTHSSSAPGRSDFTTVNTTDIPSAAARVARDVAPRVGPVWRARQQAALQANANEPLVVGVANVRASDIQFDSPRLRLGAGAFGTVYRSAKEGWQGSTVAVKELKIDVSEDTLATTLAALRREAATLASLRHQHVVSFLGVCLEASQPMLVTEYVAGGALEDALHPRGGGSSSLGNVDRLKIAKDIAAGLTHIHSQSILHRDLKPANVLLAKIDGVLIAKVADVGLARTLHGTRQYMSAKAGGGAGTPQYMSPEQWSDQELTTASDVYAYGVLLNEALTGVRPWHQVKTALAIGHKVTNGERPDSVAKGGARMLVERCWHTNRDARPSMPEVFEEVVRIVRQTDAEGALADRV